MATLQEKIYEHEDFFINKILYPMTKRKFDTLNQGAKKRVQDADEIGKDKTNKLKEIQKLLATAPNWGETEFIDIDVKIFMDKCKRKFDTDYEEYIDEIKGFISQIYIETARNLWDNVELYTDSCSNAVKDKNQDKIKKIIIESVKEQVKDFEIPEKLEKFDALSKLLDEPNGSDDNTSVGSYEGGRKTMRSDEEDQQDNDNDNEENEVQQDSDKDDEENEVQQDIENDDDEEKEIEQESDEDSVIYIENNSNDAESNDDESEASIGAHNTDDEEGSDDESEQVDNDENSETFEMDKSKVMNIMEKAETKLQNDPDLTNENIENFLKFKKFLEMTKNVKVENFEEVLQKALNKDEPEDLSPKKAPIPKPQTTRRRKASPKSKPVVVVEPSFEEIVEEEALGLFDAPLKAPDLTPKRGGGRRKQ